MMRTGWLVVMVLAVAGFRSTDKHDIAFLRGLQAPVSELAARQTAEAFIRQKLDFPPNTELTFRPLVRAFLSKPDPEKPAYVGIWMCGTVRVGSTINTATFLVAFDWDRPDLIRDGGTTFERSGRYNARWCDEIYRDGILVFPRR